MRLTWIDSLKGFAMLTVILGHAVGGYLDAGIQEYRNILQSIFDFIYAFHMPLFFMVSGYLYEITWREKKCATMEKIKDKLLDLGTLYIAFSVYFWIAKYLSASHIQMANLYTLNDLMMIGIRPLSYLWFLYVLTILFVVIPFVEYKHISKNIILLTAGIGYILLYNFGTVGMLFYGGFYFVLGSWFRVHHIENWGVLIKKKIFWGMLLICGFNMLSYLYCANTWGGIIHKIIIALAGSYIAWYCVEAFANQYTDALSKFLQLCGQYSLELYLMQNWFLGPLRTIFRKVGLDHLAACIILATILATVGPLCMALFCEKRKYFRFVFHPGEIIKIYVTK